MTMRGRRYRGLPIAEVKADKLNRQLQAHSANM